mmetsp:Transcript_22996/g.44880  ORF Transcript_22996/g.44880 Transcript_22996/m.44880 type:complete len:637 (+) Transcript_22996:1393-3303(+)
MLHTFPNSSLLGHEVDQEGRQVRRQASGVAAAVRRPHNPRAELAVRKATAAAGDKRRARQLLLPQIVLPPSAELELEQLRGQPSDGLGHQRAVGADVGAGAGEPLLLLRRVGLRAREEVAAVVPVALVVVMVVVMVMMHLAARRPALRRVPPRGRPLVVLHQGEAPVARHLRRAVRCPARRERALLAVGERALRQGALAVAAAARDERRLVPALRVARVRASALVHGGRGVAAPASSSAPSSSHRHRAIDDLALLLAVAVHHAGRAEDVLLGRPVAEVAVGVGLDGHLLATVLEDGQPEVVLAVGLGAVDAVARTHPHLIGLLVRGALLARGLVGNVSRLLDDVHLLEPVRAELGLVLGRVIDHLLLGMSEAAIARVMAGLPLEHVLATDRQVVVLAVDELGDAAGLGRGPMRVEASLAVELALAHRVRDARLDAELVHVVGVDLELFGVLVEGLGDLEALGLDQLRLLAAVSRAELRRSAAGSLRLRARVLWLILRLPQVFQAMSLGAMDSKLGANSILGERRLAELGFVQRGMIYVLLLDPVGEATAHGPRTVRDGREGTQLVREVEFSIDEARSTTNVVFVVGLDASVRLGLLAHEQGEILAVFSAELVHIEVVPRDNLLLCGSSNVGNNPRA